MAYVPQAAACLLIPFNEIPHLFVVLNDPCKDGQCLLVMLSSIKEGKHHDKACVLGKGDHDFIQVPTYVVYRLANTASARHIGNMVDKKFYTDKGVMKGEVFDQIVAGIFSSDETRGFVINYARSVGLKPPEKAPAKP
jgi:hypothetical protein